MEEWFKAHNFPYIKAPNGSYFWQTQVATGELTATNKIIFHHKNLFKEITKGYKNDNLSN